MSLVVDGFPGVRVGVREGVLVGVLVTVEDGVVVGDKVVVGVPVVLTCSCLSTGTSRRAISLSSRISCRNNCRRR